MDLDDVAFTITVEVGEDRAVMRPIGEMDVSVEDRWVEAFAMAALHPSRRIEVDMGAVTFIDTTGLTMVILAQQSASDEETTMTIVNPSKAVQRILEARGLFEAFERSA
jgi:anti-anti-sigma factor